MPRGKHPASLKNLKPIQKGEVRNPQGINRKRPFTDRMYELTEQLLNQTPEGRKIQKKFNLPEGSTWGDAAVRRLMMEAVDGGSIPAVKEMADRIEGKAPERLEISGPEKKEITIRIIHDSKK
jgi:hypothetical protein